MNDPLVPPDGTGKLGRVLAGSRRVLGHATGSATAVASASLAKAIASDASALAGHAGRWARALAGRLAKARRSPWWPAVGGLAPGDWAGRLAHAARRVSPPRKWIGAAAAVLLLAVLGSAGVLAWALHDLPSGALLAGSTEPVIVLEAADGQPMARKGPLKGPQVKAEDFPAHLVEAVLSIEDRRFRSHWGVDPRGILRALARNVSAGEVVEGGSTINQQLVKILHLERERTLKRKIREAALALWLDLRLSKDEILTRYLNNVYLGAGATGVPAAARVYFGKDAAALTLAESALLAGLIKAPSQLDPLRNPDAARKRAAVVLDAMVANGVLDERQALAAKSSPARLDPGRARQHAGTWFADWVAGEAAEITGSFRGTMHVRTTLVPSLQAAAEEAVAEGLAGAGPADATMQAALLALRPDGAVLAMVGGRDYAKSEFNRVVDAKRQPGSTFKLFVYYAALRNGFSPGDRVEDAPLDAGGWKPENFDGRYHGRVSLAEAFARSLNTAAVRLAMTVGIKEVVAAARELGIDAPLAETPSLALGTSEVSLLDLTGAYASVRAGSAPIEPWGISAFGTDEQPRLFSLGPPVKPQHQLGGHQGTLVGLLKLAVDKGTGRNAGLAGFAAGKTGTSQDYRDAWFVGFNEALVVGVWVGKDSGEPMDRVTGGEVPARIWRDFMTRAMASEQPVASTDRPAVEPAAAVEDDAKTPRCNYRACSRAYRSFRTSDCSYQPYRGSRTLCDR